MDYSLTVPNVINHFNKIKDNFDNANSSDEENKKGGLVWLLEYYYL